jgi:DNA-binding XRE family transcriptional regulator
MAVLFMNEQDLTRSFAVAIRRWRKRLKMSPKEFADFVGTSENTIYNYESGRYMPQLYTAMVIAERLGTSLDGLIRGD